MNCWHCKTELIWGGDHDGEYEDEYDMCTNLSCPSCDSLVLVYYKEPEDEPTNGNVHTGE
jgi:RNase P subunit RPR2